MDRTCSSSPRALTRGSGFTLIELMVVVAIIVMAAGLMTPTITDFFKNRQLEGIKGHFGAAFNKARLSAVNQGKPVSLVFFREGIRIFDETRKTFDPDDGFNPELAPFGTDKVWYVLGFFNQRPNTSLPQYRAWEKAQKASQAATLEAEKAASAQGGRRRRSTTVGYNLGGIPKITFQRDGSLVFSGGGGDVSSKGFTDLTKIPELSDVMIYQAGNTTACFIDFKLTGQIKYRVDPLPQLPARPAVEGAGGNKDFELEYEAPPPGKKAADVDEQGDAK